MAASECRSCVITLLFILSVLPTLFGQEYQIPNVTIQALKPRGIRISIPDSPKLRLFVFYGSINKQYGDVNSHEISAEVKKSKDGYWTFQDDSVALEVGDVIQYFVHVIRDKKGYTKNKLIYTVTELIDENHVSEASSTPNPFAFANVLTNTTNTCRSTATKVLSISLGTPSTVCSSQIVFEENFDTLREDFWTIEQYIPSKPEYPFVSYQRLPNGPTVFVENGLLHIEPKLQENLPGFDSLAVTSSKLDLTSGCTRAGSCEFTSDGGQILPPIASGRITNTIAFKYGFIEVRAKVPQGDWLYPDLLLESLFKRHGTDNYASGVMRIAGVLGNMALSKGTTEYGNKVLYGGPMMDFNCRNYLLSRKLSSTEWGNDFHVYSLRWAPDMITLFVDGEEWGRVEPPASGLQSRLPKDTCNPPRPVLNTPMAPFDDFFSISLGVSAGGVSEFPDNVLSQFAPKPWVNAARRARLSFLNAKDTWLSTWTQPALLVDYVRVRAL